MYKQLKEDFKMNDTKITCNQLDECLFFSSGKLARAIGKAAEEAFSITGLSPSHAFLLFTINQNNGIHQKKVGSLLHLTPSTITRFVEKLENKGLITRRAEGKNVRLYITEKGIQLQPTITKAWGNLHDSYSGVLTTAENDQFIQTANKLIAKLEE